MALNLLNSPIQQKRVFHADLNRELSVSIEEPKCVDQSTKGMKGEENASFNTDTGELVILDLLKQSNGNGATRTLPIDARPKPNRVVTYFTDPENRRKILKTVMLLLIYSTAGLLYGQMGPTLPDLQKISGTPLEQASWIFTGFAVGYLIGCLAGGILLEKFNAYLLLFLYTIISAAANVLLPWIPEFIAMVINRFILGVLVGGQDTAVHTMILYIWAEQGGRFIHITHTLASVGGVLSPLITEPFVTPAISSSAIVNSTINQTYVDLNSTEVNNNTLRSVRVQNTESNIHFAFLITGVLGAMASIPSLYVYFIEKDVKKTSSQPSTESKTNASTKLPNNIKMVVLVILFINSFLATATMDMFPSFLTTFVIEQLNWSQSTGTLLTAIFFGGYAIGNLIAAFTYSFLPTTILVIGSYISTVVILVLMLVGSVFENDILLWCTMSLIGVTASVLLPVLFGWTQNNVTPVTGRIASAFLFSGSAGVMANPLFLGYFMDNFTPMWFLYCSLGEIALCVVTFMAAFGLVRLYSSEEEVVEVQQANVSQADQKNDDTMSSHYVTRL